MSRFPAWYAPGQNAAIAAPAGWDRIRVGGDALEAWAQITSGAEGPALKIDPRKKAGATAAHPTIHGIDAWEFAFRIACVDRDQLDAIDAAWQRLFELPDPTAKPPRPRPVSVDHPALYSVAAKLGTINALLRNLPVWSPSGTIPRGREATMRFLYWPAAAKGAQGLKSSSPQQVRKPLNLIDKNTAGYGTVLKPPTDSPDYAKPAWP